MKKYSKILVAVLACMALVAAFAIAGCSSGSSSSSSTSSSSSSSQAKQTVKLQVYAANSLEKVLKQVQDKYTAKNPNVTFSDTQFEASGTLVNKLKDASDSADILITASKATMDTAVKNGSVDEATRADMFKNDLVICSATNSGIKVTSIADLASPSITSIAIGEPNAVPAGKYALQALKSAGLATYDEDSSGTVSNIVYADSIASKMNAGADKVGTVASYVKNGTCQVGFVYTSDIYRYDGITSIFTTPADSHKNIVYPGAVTKGTKNAEAAADFLKFCTTDADAIALFQQYGFEIAS